MANFVKEWKRNNRFTVNRFERVKLKLSQVEIDVWLKLVSVLQDRRNTGPQIETLLYLVKKYEPIIKPDSTFVRAEWATVKRTKQLFFKVSEEEKNLWNKLTEKFKGSSINAFLYIVDKEYNFQDDLEIIPE